MATRWPTARLPIWQTAIGTPGRFSAGAAITVPTKAGWDYLWVRYEKIEDAGFVFPIPVHAYVEKVYERFAFAQLFGFG